MTVTAPATIEASGAADRPTRLLVIATLLCSYPGIDATGQAHMEYPPNTYVIPTPDPVMFPESFYLYCFEQGVDAILIASCGTDSPYKGSFEQLAAQVDRTYVLMKERGIDIRRLKLTAICSVCTKAFIKEVADMEGVLGDLGPIAPLAPAPAPDGERAGEAAA
jgi:coenzyme F420-reducing hydrogenase delta subunit